jgi:hypothetical protein
MPRQVTKFKLCKDGVKLKKKSKIERRRKEREEIHSVKLEILCTKLKIHKQSVQVKLRHVRQSK